jgi:predicted neuraminidase
VRLPDGRLLCAFNDFTPPQRDRLTLRLALSADEGRTWTRIATIDRQKDASVSYPFMILGRDGVVRMVYTFRVTNIRYAEFNTAWVDEQAARVAAGEVLP